MPESHVLEPSQHPINKKEQERTQKQPAKRPRNLSLKSTKVQKDKMAKGLRGPVGAAFMPLKGRGRCQGNPRLSVPYRRLRGRWKRVISGSRRIPPWCQPMAPAVPERPSERFSTRRGVRVTCQPAEHPRRASNRLGADRRRALSPVPGARPAIRHGLGSVCPFWCPPTRRE